MTELARKSRQYYLLFNLPIQLIGLTSIALGLVNWYIVLGFYIVVYWIGIQAGSHKLFTHKSWEPKYSWLKYLIAIISCFGLMGGPIIWAGMHRLHHANSDSDKDPHSPKNGFIHAYAGWLLNPPNVSPTMVRDCLRDKPLITIDKYCKEIVLIILAILFAIDIIIAFSLIVAMTITFHCEMSVNTFLHSEKNNHWSARNSVILALISGGSTLHLNHHNNASSFTFSNHWYELDPSAWIIRMFKK